MDLDEIARRKINLDILSKLEQRPSEAGVSYQNTQRSILVFSSHKGVEISTIYHTFIDTCKINGISTIEYLRNC